MGRDNKEKIKLYKKNSSKFKEIRNWQKKQIRIYWYYSH